MARYIIRLSALLLVIAVFWAASGEGGARAEATRDRMSRTYRYADLEADIAAWEALELTWVQCETIGSSLKDRAIYAVTLGTGSTYALVFAGLHGNEIANTPMLMQAADELIARVQAGDKATAELLERVTLVLLPCGNPDGFETSTGFAASNINYVKKGNADGVNLNRNFPTPYWGNKAKRGELDYAGPSAGSEPETQAMTELARRHPYSAMIDMHSCGRQIYCGKGGFAQEDVETALDVGVLDDMTRRLAEAICPAGYYVNEQSPASRDSGFGSSTDELFSLGVPAVTMETVPSRVKGVQTPAIIAGEYKLLKLPELLLAFCEAAAAFDTELHPAR